MESTESTESTGGGSFSELEELEELMAGTPETSKISEKSAGGSKKGGLFSKKKSSGVPESGGAQAPTQQTPPTSAEEASVIMSGKLIKKGIRGFAHERFFVLSSDGKLKYYEGDNADESRKKGAFELKKYKQVDVNNGQLRLHPNLDSGGEKMRYLQLPSNSEGVTLDQWATKINGVIREI